MSTEEQFTKAIEDVVIGNVEKDDEVEPQPKKTWASSKTAYRDTKEHSKISFTSDSEAKTNNETTNNETTSSRREELIRRS